MTYEPFKIGIVSTVDRKKCTARVVFEDLDNSVSYNLKVLVRNTLKKKDYWMPEEKEAVLCIFLGNGIETGFIFGSFYSEEDKPPEEISEDGKERVGLWIDENNYIKWVEEERKFVVKSEKPVEWITP